MRALGVLGLDSDIDLIAAEDEVGRKLQNGIHGELPAHFDWFGILDELVDHREMPYRNGSLRVRQMATRWPRWHYRDMRSESPNREPTNARSPSVFR